MRQRPTDDREAYFFSELDFSGRENSVLVQRVEQNPTEMHGHDFTEIVFIIEGTGTHVTARMSYSIGSGDFFVIPPASFHRYSQADSLKLVNVLVKDEYMKSILSPLKGMSGFASAISPDGGFVRPPQLSKERLDSCMEILGRLESELWEGGEASESMVSSLLTELMVKTVRYASSPESLALKDWPGFGRISEYMEAHIQRPATIAAMAKAGGVSKRTLLRRFKIQTGMSPMECLNNMRLSKACRLLRETSFEVKNVAIACGFHDSNYFARQFRKTIGTSPKQFRRSISLARQSISAPSPASDTPLGSRRTPS